MIAHNQRKQRQWLRRQAEASTGAFDNEDVDGYEFPAAATTADAGDNDAGAAVVANDTDGHEDDERLERRS